MGPAFISETCTASEAAEALGVSVPTAQQWLEEGRLQAWETPAGHRRILRHSVDDMLANRQAANSAEGATFDALIVEDDPIYCRLYEAALRKASPEISVRSAGSGREGLLKIAERLPNILLADLQMADLDGFQMLEIAGYTAQGRAMQIIVATGLDDDEIAQRGGLPHGAALFHKPVPINELIEMVRARRADWLALQSAG